MRTEAFICAPRRSARAPPDLPRARILGYGREAPHARARHFLHADAFHEIGDGKAAARARQRRPWAARGSCRWRSRRRFARSNRRGKCCRRSRCGRAGRRRRSARLRCSGAKRFTNRAAAAILRATNAPPFFVSERRARFVFGSCANWRSISRATARASRADVVTKSEVASGSCSACAMQVRGDESRVAARRRIRALRWARRACRSRNRCSRCASRR